MFRRMDLALAALVFVATGLSARADDFTVDAVHSGVSFRALHMGMSWIPGRFNDISGNFSVDAKNPATARFELIAKVDSVDTNNKKRDEHLKAPDFFDAKQFPTITFKSKSAKAVDGGLEVTGELTMHGVIKPLTITLKGGKTVEMRGATSIGYTADFTIKRSDFGMDKHLEALGDEVQVQFGFEGKKK